MEKEHLWMVIPRRVAFGYVANPAYKATMRKLIGEGNVVNPLLYPPDMGFGRSIRTFKSIMSHHLKYRKYLGKP